MTDEKTWKNRFHKAKRHIPAVVGAIATIAATAVAIHYRNEVKKYKTYESDDWSVIRVHPRVRERLSHGDILKYREVQINPDELYAQHTTNSGFSEDADEQFEKARAEAGF